MAAGANHVGAPHNKENAEFVLQQFRAWGWDAQIEQFDVLYPTLKRHSLELLGPTKFVASLTEPPIAGDETSARTDGMPPYHVYGADGDVTADLVYVNYGMPDDYKELARRGIDVKGKIVIARYGQGWRGLKPKLAYEHGAVGCLIYSDPQDDGYSAGRCLSERWLASGRQRAARIGRGHAGIFRRSADPRRGRHEAGEAPAARAGSDRSQDSGDAHLLRRCAAVARRSRGARGAGEAGAAHCPSPITSVPGPRKCT